MLKMLRSAFYECKVAWANRRVAFFVVKQIVFGTPFWKVEHLPGKIKMFL